MCRKIVKNHVVKNSRLCFILSCPGKEEAKNNKVCSGATGDNLNKILKKSNAIDSSKVCYTNRYKYSIGNSSIIVHPINNEKKSEPKNTEIKSNIDTLQKFINKVKPINIIFCGRKAQYARDLLIKNRFIDNSINLIDMPHLGNRGINSINKYVAGIRKGTKKENKLERLAKYLNLKMI